LNMKFTNSGIKLVIHLVGSLPPKLNKDKKKMISITFPQVPPVRNRKVKP